MSHLFDAINVEIRLLIIGILSCIYNDPREFHLSAKTFMDAFWLKDDNLDNLPAPDILQQEIIDHLEAALAAFKDVAAGLPETIVAIDQ